MNQIEFLVIKELYFQRDGCWEQDSFWMNLFTVASKGCSHMFCKNKSLSVSKKIQFLPYCERGSLILSFCVLFFLNSVAESNEKTESKNDTDLSHVISIVGTQDSKVKNIEWHVLFKEGELTITDGLWQMKNVSPSGFDGTILIDCLSDRYLATFSVLSKASGGDGQLLSELLNVKSSLSHDGAFYRQWKQSGLQKNAGDVVDQYGEGLIDVDDKTLNDATFEKTYGSVAGVFWMPPHFNVEPGSNTQTDSLADFLLGNQSKGIDIELKKSNGFWIINTQAVQVPGEYPISTEIHLDIDKLAVSEQIWYYSFKGKREILDHAKIKLQSVDSIWLPEEVFYVEFTTKNKRCMRWSFDKVKVNRNLIPDDFIVKFPPDIHLMDYVHKKLYLTGSSIADEQAAVRDFLIRTNSLSSLKDTPNESKGTFSKIVIANIIALLCIIVFIIYRRFKVKNLVILLALLFPSTLIAGPDTAKPNLSQSFLSFSPGEKITISRCGLRAVFCALEYFHIQSNPPIVNNSLRKYWDEIPLSDIVNVLISHNLKVTLRKNTDLESVGKAVTLNRIAIIPVKISPKWNHYYLIIRTSDNKLRVLDPPYTSHDFATALSPKALEPTNGVVAFVELPPKEFVLPDPKILFEPTTVDFGDICIEGALGSRVLHKKVKVTNQGSRPVMVSNIVSSCGCAKFEWTGGLIRPKESRTLILNLKPSAWGTGRQIKPIKFIFAGAEPDIEMHVSANGLNLEKTHGVTISASRVRILEPLSKTDKPLKFIIVKGNHVNNLIIKSTEPWLSVDVIKEGNIATLELNLLPEHITRSRKTRNSLDGSILLSTREEYDPVSIPVKVILQNRISFKPEELLISTESAEKSYSIEVVSSDPEDKIKKVIIESHKPSGLDVAIGNQTKGNTSLIVVAKNNQIQHKMFVIKCSVVLESGFTETVEYLVRLKSG